MVTSIDAKWTCYIREDKGIRATTYGRVFGLQECLRLIITRKAVVSTQLHQQWMNLSKAEVKFYNFGNNFHNFPRRG